MCKKVVTYLFDNFIFMHKLIQKCVNKSCDTKLSLLLLVCIIEIHSAMKYNSKNFALILFVLSTTLILGSTNYAFADHAVPDGVDGDGTVEGCLNDVDGSCDTVIEWKSQNISQDALYFEGDSIPIRFDITNLDAANYHELIFEYDITKMTGGTVKHPFDYITTYNVSDTPIPYVGPDFGAGFVPDSEPLTGPLEITTYQTVDDISQPDTSFVNSWTDDEKKFWMFAPFGETIDIQHVEYLSNGLPGDDGSQTETNQVRVIFETSSTHVVAAFGAHLGNPNDWLHGAGEINGKSFQIDCVSVNGNNCTDHVNIDSSLIISLPEISIGDVSQAEGDSGDTDFTFILTRTGDLSRSSTVDFTTSDGTATTVDNDYNSNSGTANFNVNSDTTSVTITVTGDTAIENDETFTVNLSSPFQAVISDGEGLGTIEDDDGGITIDDVSQAEGDSGDTDFTFTLTRSGDLSESATVDYTTSDGTATIADSDYVTNSGTAIFAALSDTTTLTVTVNGDNAQEPNETFTVDLTNPVDVIISDNTGVGTILDDDGGFTIDDVTAVEDDSPSTPTFQFTITRSGDLSEAATIDYATSDVSATSPSDYTAIPTTTANFAADQTTATVDVTVIGDADIETDETFNVILSNQSDGLLMEQSLMMMVDLQ
jgi:hypothetical protein